MGGGLPAGSDERPHRGIFPGQEVRGRARRCAGTDLGEVGTVHDGQHFPCLGVHVDHGSGDDGLPQLGVAREDRNDLQAQGLGLLDIGRHKKSLTFVLAHVDIRPQRDDGSPLGKEPESLFHSLYGFSH